MFIYTFTLIVVAWLIVDKPFTAKIEDFFSKHKSSERELSESILQSGMEDVEMNDNEQNVQSRPQGLKYLDQLVSLLLYSFNVKIYALSPV